MKEKIKQIIIKKIHRKTKCINLALSTLEITKKCNYALLQKLLPTIVKEWCYKLKNKLLISDSNSTLLKKKTRLACHS